MFNDYIIPIFGNPPWLNITFLLLALVGIILAFIFYYRSKRERIPVYAIRNVNLIEEKVEKIKSIKILYRDSPVENLSISRIALWNKGKETISRNDLAPANPLKLISVGETNLLEVSLIYKKTEANNFVLLPVQAENGNHLQKQMVIDFDYFDWNEGVILQVFHTGKTSNDLKLDGVIKGGGPIQKISDPFFLKIAKPLNFLDKVKRRHRRLIAGTLLFSTPLILVISELFFPKLKSPNNFIIKFLPPLFLFLLYWTAAFSMLRKRMPRGFELFEDEIRP